MSQVAVTVPPAAPAAAPAEPAQTMEQRAAATLAKHALAQDRAILEERAAEAGVTPATATPPPAKDKAGKERAPDGKFKPKETPAEPAAAEPKPKAPPPLADEPYSVKNARNLFEKGDIVGAVDKTLRAVLGKGIDELKIPSKQFAALRVERTEANAKLTADRQQLDAEIRQAQQVLNPLIQAKVAHDAKDFDGFAKALGYASFSELSKEALHSYATESPEVKRIRSEVNALREEQRQLNAAKAQQASQAQQIEAVQTVMTQIQTELAGSDDERMTWAAERPAFRRRTFEIMREHWDPRSETTLPPIEAAEKAYAEMYGEDFSPSARGAAAPARQPAEADTSRGGGRKPPTTLNPRQAAEAGPTPKLKGQALIDHYKVKAEQEALRERLG